MSKYFKNCKSVDIPTKLLQCATSLNQKLKNLAFEQPVQYVYNPVEYAYEMHAAFIKKYCSNKKKILLLGLNPGPWGMVQTGIPFGEIHMVKDWYKIQAQINKPEVECPERKIMGLSCNISEISGKRIYELFQKISITPEIFLQHAYLYNFCPLAFMERNGKNITPASLTGSVINDLEGYCRQTLIEILKLLKTEIIIAIGVYAKTQSKIILKEYNINNIQVIYMPHPSPIVKGNENWGEKAQKVLEQNDLLKYFMVQQ